MLVQRSQLRVRWILEKSHGKLARLGVDPLEPGEGGKCRCGGDHDLLIVLVQLSPRRQELGGSWVICPELVVVSCGSLGHIRLHGLVKGLIFRD
jgi:hypothetical protein